ncbi:uncharacterized protein K02A2.6-like [Zingiber officinale]|uniref:uncharacterized protein K02A2.6-like n=1 Tax=Zingiber officinale TaxID=94328 RepID=UPI001C4C63C4|nr:uncharacterized protein K02A2.6-like [Zingiber officinale]
MAPGQKHFLLLDVDYFSKWVEAEALARITEDAVIQFLWKNILCKFGIPHKLVSDNGRQFQRKKIQAWCKGFGIMQTFTSVAYPQSNGQTEVVNREIVRGLKVKLDHVGGPSAEPEGAEGAPEKALKVRQLVKGDVRGQLRCSDAVAGWKIELAEARSEPQVE